jgi:hypothetical protein
MTFSPAEEARNSKANMINPEINKVGVEKNRPSG